MQQGRVRLNWLGQKQREQRIYAATSSLVAVFAGETIVSGFSDQHFLSQWTVLYCTGPCDEDDSDKGVLFWIAQVDPDYPIIEGHSQFRAKVAEVFSDPAGDVAEGTTCYVVCNFNEMDFSTDCLICKVM